MRFLERARALYEEKGRDMIKNNFAEYEGRIAVGLAGRGSQCYGFDDELSADHDYTLGFCLWLDDETESAIGLELRRAYRDILPGGKAQRSAMGGDGMGVCPIGDFFLPYTGTRGAPTELLHWLKLPSHALAEATNGQVWRDEAGEFSAIRQRLLHDMPEDVRIKKLAAAVLIMAQSGQYNYSRCLKRGEQGAAMLALTEFVKAACSAIYLLNRRHMPYYKWTFRGMDTLEQLSQLKGALEFLLTAENDGDGQRLKADIVEDICSQIVQQLKAQRLSCGSWDYLEPHALDMHEHIHNAQLRSLHILEGW